MTEEAIKDAIGQLSEADRRQLADWFEELEERAWDDEIERDFSPGGRGMPLLAELEQDIADGKTRPLEVVCGERRKRKA
jgi:hypothetical protein